VNAAFIPPPPALPASIRISGVGIDVVQISRIAESLEKFGERFMRRVFTSDEIAYATSAPALLTQRLAARFAAKEATIKALKLSLQGVGWKDLEVRRENTGACNIELHGAARRAAEADGVTTMALSMSHDGDYAAAIVIAA
jgi:holo-[acyl-carrier protein] synthase